jgi:hypothetical protein
MDECQKITNVKKISTMPPNLYDRGGGRTISWVWVVRVRGVSISFYSLEAIIILFGMGGE